ncbi:3'-5' exonuclease [Vibrio ulleungensis]|uniref:3'-5' exonuclease n=1 Tax=Vibrio ulleungensis TaxID=2807619 RepID=A0ABS2HKW3_9VIBR|nr:3'-5' exonuclease [Vibrio ulleungensis]MBM7037192.1 3'-5' exonuclease [Vibrio ulleungensis]
MKLYNKLFHPLSKFLREREQYNHSVELPKQLYALSSSPEVTLDTEAKSLDYIALDLETTGLDSSEDRILSMGWVEMSDNRIDLQTSKHILIDSKSQIKPETAVINHITPEMLKTGISIHDAMAAFFKAAEGKVIVAHATVVEQRFIARYLERSFHHQGLPLLWLDTMCIEKHMANSLNRPDTDVSLGTTRERYHLPVYAAHNALTDAVATAELLLAQMNRLNSATPLCFAKLFRLSQ